MDLVGVPRQPRALSGWHLHVTSQSAATVRRVFGRGQSTLLSPVSTKQGRRPNGSLCETPMQLGYVEDPVNCYCFLVILKTPLRSIPMKETDVIQFNENHSLRSLFPYQSKDIKLVLVLKIPLVKEFFSAP